MLKNKKKLLQKNPISVILNFNSLKGKRAYISEFEFPIAEIVPELKRKTVFIIKEKKKNIFKSICS